MAFDPIAVVRELAAVPERLAGSDAERRAAVVLAKRLRASGRSAQVETVWVRPHSALVIALHCVLGVIGSVLSVSAHIAGLAVLAVTLVSVLLDAAGRPSLRRLTPERATQNVVSPPPRRKIGGKRQRVRLLLCATYDAPLTGLARRGWAQRLGSAGGGRLPGADAWLALALLVLLLVAGARQGSTTGTLLGVVQLIPTAGLIVGLAAALDSVTAEAGPGGGDPLTGVAAVLALARELDAGAPSELDVELVFSGAGVPGALGMLTYVRARRRTLRREDVAVLDLGACGTGEPRWIVSGGTLLPARLHHGMVAAARRAADAEPQLAAGPARSRRRTPARVARAARWPALRVEARDERGLVPRSGTPGDTADAVDAAAVRATVSLALGVIDELDEELAERARTSGTPAPRPAPAAHPAQPAASRSPPRSAGPS